MKLVTLIKSYLLMVLILSMGSVLLKIWSVRSCSIHNERLEILHHSYQLHLVLSADTYLLFKRYGDLLLGGSSAAEAENEQLIIKLRETIASLKAVVSEEINLVGAEEMDELARVNQIEKVIENLITQFRTTRQTTDHSDIQRGWLDHNSILVNDLKQDFRALIAAAMAAEHQEVATARSSEATAYAHARAISILLGIAFLLVSAGAGVVFRRRFTRPLDTLMSGVNQFAEGDFNASINLKGRDELSQIGTLLDQMAKVVLTQSRDLIERNEKLESAVQARTAELEDMLAREQRSQEVRRQLLADVSHELRTPLTVIQGESEVALRGAEKTPAEYREALQRARDAAVHTATLVNDLLFIARSEMGRVLLQPMRFDLVELLHEVAGLSGQMAQVQSTLETAPIEADHQRLRQVVLALVHNARHHGGDLVTIGLEQSFEDYMISVEDDGPGVSDEDKERVFDRFYRGPNASKTSVDGLGLGLPIVRSIAEAHGGAAWIADRERGGTIVRIKVPKTQKERKTLDEYPARRG